MDIDSIIAKFQILEMQKEALQDEIYNLYNKNRETRNIIIALCIYIILLSIVVLFALF